MAKNERTGKRYKAAVRILKNLRGEMAEAGIEAAKGIPSYLISCLVWNVPDELFGEEEYVDMMEKILNSLINATKDSVTVQEWGEVNELKYLFRDTQPWTVTKAHYFLAAAKSYLQGQK